MIETLVEASGKSTTTYGAAPPMTIAGLHMAIKGRMSELAARFPMQTKTGVRAPKIVDGWLPPKENAEVENFPFLIVRPVQGVGTEQSAAEQETAVFELVGGTYSDTDDGFMDAIRLIDAIRLDIGAKPRIEGTAFAHQGPMTWRVEAARPQWLGIVTTVWLLPRPQRIETEV